MYDVNFTLLAVTFHTKWNCIFWDSEYSFFLWLCHMNTKFSFSYQIFTAGLCVCLLSACGGGSGGDSTTGNTTPTVEKINGIEVPPAPDTAKNNATLAGVDSNSNGVRDDVERAIAKNVKDLITYDASLKVANAYQDMITSPVKTREDTLKIYGKIACVQGAYHVNQTDYYQEITFNTIERKYAYSDFLNIVRGGFEGSDLPNCQ